MARNEAKLGATFFIWLALTVITLALLGAEQFNFIIGAILAGAAMIGTITVWESDKDGKADKEAKSSEKAKRRSRVEKLVENLSDDELEELRARLVADSADGELVSVDDLLNEIDRRSVR